MAWFRAGGAGIPSSLKSGMNDVLNKKFGTSTTYPPSDWPSDVNLLGPLPEKTASGAIASFTDGADEVPLKSLVFGITPSGGGGTPSSPVPIVGYTELTGVHCGKNLLNIDNVYGKGYWDTDGGWHANSTYSGYKIAVKPETTYTISGNFGGVICYLDSTGTFISGTNQGAGFSKTFTTPSGCYYIERALLDSSIDGTQMLEVGNQATTYSPYSAESKKWEFGQTVYSGQVNALTGETESDAKLFDMGSLTWYADSNRTGLFYTGLISNAAYTECAIMCEEFLVNNAKNPNTISDNEMSSMNSYGSNRIFIKNTAWDGYTGAQVATAVSGIKVLIKLATPISIDMDSVDWQSKYADNNIYCDTGDTSCEYRADIALALGN